jgi:hypothetical protein
VLAQAPADRERASDLYDAALAEARSIGMPRLVTNAERLVLGASSARVR